MGLTPVIPDHVIPENVIPDLPFVIPDLPFVIPDLPFVIPDPIRDLLSHAQPEPLRVVEGACPARTVAAPPGLPTPRHPRLSSRHPGPAFRHPGPDPGSIHQSL